MVKRTGGRIRAGEVVEVGYVVDDLSTAARHFSLALGAGPFFVYRNLAMKNTRVGQKPVNIDIDVALGACGSFVLELIVQNCETQSPFLGHEPGSRPEVNHWSLFVDDFYASRQRQLSEGYTEALSAEIGIDGESARLSYFDTRAQLGAYVELMEANPPGLLDSYQAVLDAAVNWDGTSLLREVR